MASDFLPSSPLVLNWALSNRCTFRCRHCYSRTEPDGELDTATVRRLLANVAEAGVLSVNFGGGEPLLRADLLDLAACATACGLAVSLNSNGFLLDRAAAGALARAGVRKVGISLDSPRADVHDAFRGVPGSHARALAALGHLVDAGVEASVSCVICRINADDLEALVEVASAAGASAVNFHDFKCSGMGLANRDELDLDPDAWRRVYGRALALRACSSVRVLVEDPVTSLLEPRRGAVKGSVCGKVSLYVRTNGDVTPCGFIPIVLGNLSRDDLRAIWNTSDVLASLRRKRPQGKCAGCGHWSDCLGGCPARALALTGDLASPDPHCWG
jgi:GeoRSP system radical SAM/SPASM protein